MHSNSSIIFEFARAVDPDSQVFKQTVCSRTSITRRLVEIHEFIKKELREDICRALFWSYMLDESTDKAVAEEVIIYVRFVHIPMDSQLLGFWQLVQQKAIQMQVIFSQQLKG